MLYSKIYAISTLRNKTWTTKWVTTLLKGLFFIYQPIYFLNFFLMIPIESGSLLWSHQIILKNIKNIQQIFKKSRSSILNLIRRMQHNPLNLELHHFFTNVLRPIFFIITTIKYTSLRGSIKTSFKIDFICWLVHIKHPLDNQYNMVNIINSILYLLSEEIQIRNFFILIEFWFKFSNKLLLK